MKIKTDVKKDGMNLIPSCDYKYFYFLRVDTASMVRLSLS